MSTRDGMVSHSDSRWDRRVMMMRWLVVDVTIINCVLLVAHADKELLVIDSTKLNVLDRLLSKLKRERHRVLIYCQMTRMIDLLEV